MQRALGPCKIGLVDNYQVPVPIVETPENIIAANKAFRRMNGDILVPTLTGNYDPGMMADLGPSAPSIEDGDLAIIHQPIDALGLNVYSGCYVRADDNEQGYSVEPLPQGYPRLHMPWLNILPDVIYWGVRHVSEALDRPELEMFISENGCACEDTVEPDGRVVDTDRILYLRHHFRSAHRAVDEGYPLKGYYV